MNRAIVFFAANLFMIPSTFSSRCITGTVISDNAYPIPYATISGNNGKGVVCDSIGTFEFCSSSDIIIVSALGYLPDTLLAKDVPTVLSVTLAKMQVALDEVAVCKQSVALQGNTSAFVATNEQIVCLNPVSVTDVLQTKAGFTNRSGYQSPLTLRGMSGKRLLVLRNGQRRFSSYPSGYMSHIVNVYELDRIEVEKGAASVRYGAGAMAGIINLVDCLPWGTDGMRTKLTTGYGTTNAEKTVLANTGWCKGDYALKAGMRYRVADDFHYADRSVAENSSYTDQDASFSAGYRVDADKQLVLSADLHNGGPWGKAVGFNGSDYMRVGTTVERSANCNLRYSANFPNSGRKLNASVYYSNERRELEKKYYTAAGYRLSYVETTRFSDYYYGGKINCTIPIAEKQSIEAGGEVFSFHISTPTDAVDYIEAVSFQNRVSKNARSYSAGAYAEHSIASGRHFRFTEGIRYDYVSVFEGDVYDLEQNQELQVSKHALSGNLATIFRADGDFSVKCNFARSFRMPETTELYADSYTANGILYGNPALKPEYCYSIDADAKYAPGNISFSISPFLWLMDNMVTKEEIKGMPGTNYQFVNVGRSRLWGGECNAELPIETLLGTHDVLVLSGGVAYLNGTDVSESGDFLGHGTPLDYVPPFNLKSQLEYRVAVPKKLMWMLQFRSVHYARKNRLGPQNYATPSYWVFGCTAGLHFLRVALQPSVNLAIHNICNAEYYSYYSYLPNEGRNIKLFISLTID